MSVAKIHNAGKNRILNILFGATPVDGIYYLGLYTNPTELASSAVLADITELSGSGYARKSLIRGVAKWTIIDAAAVYATIQTFLAASDWGDVWGYFIATTLNNSGLLIATEHFDSALTVVTGKGIKLQPMITAG